MLQLRTDTIAAIATAPGRGAVALVRVSGADAHTLVAPCLRPWPAVPRRVVHAHVVDPATGRAIDDVLATRFDAPASYTGEPMVEVSCHGGAAAPRAVLDLLVARGARHAEPGEFTRRAVLNGKMDLLQAEGVLELVESRTIAHKDVALAQVHGGLSRHVDALRRTLLQLEALLAYDVDFPEEDDGPIPRDRILAAARDVTGQLDALAATAPLAEVARDGALVVIAGEPNAGKSSLFNALLGEDRAIVTEVPGTTRDAVEARIERAPWPLRLVDTAGLRETEDRVERLGIAVSERHLQAAHVVLACGDSLHAVDAAVQAARTHAPGAILPVRTKGDLRGSVAPPEGVVVSAQARTGLDDLLARIDALLQDKLGAMPEDGRVLTRPRQQRAIARAAGELALFTEAWAARTLPTTVAAVHVRAAVHELDELIGRVDVEDVLDELFRRFCVGK